MHDDNGRLPFDGQLFPTLKLKEDRLECTLRTKKIKK